MRIAAIWLLPFTAVNRLTKTQMPDLCVCLQATMTQCRQMYF
jgi:hypothetical protein